MNVKTRNALAVAGLVLLAACGGGGGGGSSGPSTFTIGGSVSGLGSGKQVVLTNGAESLTVGASGTFSFKTAVAQNGSYAVGVQTQPTGQTCTVTKGSGTNLAANVIDVQVSCANNTISGTVSGLTSGTLVLQNNGADNLSVTANGSFSFATPVNNNGSYAVTVLTQPAGSTCSVSNGSGSHVVSGVSNVQVVCSPTTYSIGGSISGLTAGNPVTLQNNGGDSLNVTANGTFTFPTKVAQGGGYDVTVQTNPAGETCSLTGQTGTGTNVTANVTSVGITCSAQTFTIGGTVSGLTAGTNLSLLNNGGDSLPITGNGPFTFSTHVAYGGSYAVTTGTLTAGWSCLLVNDARANVQANITDVAVTCYNFSATLNAPLPTQVATGTTKYPLNVTVSGAPGTGPITYQWTVTPATAFIVIDSATSNSPTGSTIQFPVGTPAGNYTVTLTMTQGNLSSVVTFQVTVL